MTRTIFVPQGNPVTSAIKLSIAVELLSNRIDTMEVQFAENPELLSVDDWEDCVKCMKFLNEEGRKDYRTIDSIQDYVDDYYRELELKRVVNRFSYLR